MDNAQVATSSASVGDRKSEREREGERDEEGVAVVAALEL